MADDNCLDAGDAKGPVKLIRCHGMGGTRYFFKLLCHSATKIFVAGNQVWEYDIETKAIVHKNTGMCLDKADTNKDSTLPTLKRCDGRKSQRWTMHSNFKWQASNHEPSETEDEEEET